jgi:phospholipid/cholesterol/gamma-HCH transport system substrate-binding protein
LAGDRRAKIRVGLLVVGAAVALMAGLFMIGEQNRLFARKNRYTFTTKNVSGLNERNPVRLNGVTVGVVERITLPEDVHLQLLTVRISIERQYEERIRKDSTARIRTLGLLGDKYVEVTSGSPQAPMIQPGGSIPTAPDTDVDKLIASGGDVVDNMVRISYSLSRILERADRGEGLIGQLTTDEPGNMGEQIATTLTSVQRVMDRIDQGKGAFGRLVSDERLGNELASAVGRLESLLAQAERDDNLMASLLRSPETRASFESTLAEARQAATSLKTWTAAVEGNDSVANRLLTNEEVGARVGRDFEAIVHDLSSVASKLDRGKGSAAMLINDPKIFDAVNDIVVGVNQSKMLRWLIRNRQKKGIETRYKAAGGPPVSRAEDAEPAPNAATGLALATPPPPTETASDAGAAPLGPTPPAAGAGPAPSPTPPNR